MKKAVSEIINEIKRAKNLTQKQLAYLLGVNVTRIKSLSSGKVSKLTQEENKALVETLRVNPFWISTGNGDIFLPDSSFVENPEEGEFSGYVLVPRYGVKGNAESRGLIHSELVVDHLAFREAWLLRMRLNKNMLALITIAGDSMAPSLQNNDMVLVDLRINSFAQDDIYVILHRDHLLIKRIQIKMDGTVVVISDNPVYAQEELKLADAGNLVVVGRVVWFGREL